jgi:hypothetical protein
MMQDVESCTASFQSPQYPHNTSANKQHASHDHKRMYEVQLTDRLARKENWLCQGQEVDHCVSLKEL